ncbi:unnamed protein product [Schistocephalus solidus]|uniref:Hydrocephalus-inducing protein homolog n=1 Tax=Schistocephalus solidus TaxID=70667 RepID=A0A183SVV9_SCHSO|nr:unnamed protein product [Schistocephalus solidus]
MPESRRPDAVEDEGGWRGVGANGLHFGNIRVGEEVKQQMVLKNRGIYEISYKSFREVEFDGENLLHCEVYEPHYKQGPELIASIPIPITVKVNFSKFSIIPSKEMSFGAMLLHSRKSRQFAIENYGGFDFKFTIMPMAKAQELRAARGVTKEGRRMSRHKVIDIPSTKGGGSRLQLGPFSVNPASGVVPAGSCQPVTVDCAVDTLGFFQEELCLDISDRDASEGPLGLSYVLLAEACVPYINVDDIADIFEEHRICKNYEMLQAIKDTENLEGTFIVEENRFLFADTLVGTRCQARFRLTNPSKVPVDVHFSVKAGVGESGSGVSGSGVSGSGVRSHNPSTVRGSTTSRSGITGGSRSERRSVWGKGQAGAFEVEPSRSLIPPCGSVYVSVIFCPPSIQAMTGITFYTLQVYSGLFEAAVDLGNPSQQTDVSSVAGLEHTDAQKTLVFELCGQGHLPRISILRPSLRNLRGELTCVFPRIRAKEIVKREIVFLNDGNFVSMVISCCLDIKQSTLVELDESNSHLYFCVNINLIDSCGAFSIECPEDEREKVIYLCDTRKDVDHYEEPWRDHQEMRVWADLSGRPYTGSFQVRPRETLQLYARFRPTAADARFAARLQVTVLNNAYDTTVIELIGETREEKTGVQLTGMPRLERARAEAIQSAITSSAAQPPKDCPFSLETTLPKPLGQSWLKELDVAAVDVCRIEGPQAGPSSYSDIQNQKAISFAELLDNHLDFGDCALGETLTHKFFLTYTREVPEVEDSGVSSESGTEENSDEDAACSQEGLPSFQFEWPQNHPQLRFEPVTGQLHSGQSVPIKATFSSTTPVRLRFAPVVCALKRLEKPKAAAAQGSRETQAREQIFEEASEQLPNVLPRNSATEISPKTANPDSTLRRRRSAHKSSNLVGSESIQRNPTEVVESPHADDQLEPPVELLVSAIADYAHFQCDASEMDFGEVQIFDSQRRQVAIRNNGFVTLKFAFTRPVYDDTVDQVTEIDRGQSPFRIHLMEGTVLPGATQQIYVDFCPKEAKKYIEHLVLHVDNTEMTSPAQTSMMPGTSHPTQNLPQSKTEDEVTEVGNWPIHLIGVAVDRIVKFTTVGRDGSWTELDTLSLESPASDAHLLELSAVGAGSRASRNLVITNTSQTSYSIHFRNTKKVVVKHDEIVSFSPVFLSLEPGCSEQVELTFTGQLQETVQSNWEVRIPELDATFPLLIVGRTREPMVTFDRANFTLPTTLVGHTVSRTEVCLVNRESDTAYDFAISDKSCLSENLTNRLTVSPHRGRIQPGERLPLTISFCPGQPKRFNFNLICHIKGKRPQRLNVKAEGFTVQTSAWLDGDLDTQPHGVDHLLEPSLGETAAKAALGVIRKFENFPTLRSRLVDLQFGEVACGGEHVRQITLINHGTFEVEFAALIHSLRRPIQKTRAKARELNKLTNNLTQMVFIEPSNGLIAAGSRVTLSAHFLPQGGQKDPFCPPRHIFLDNNLFALITVKDGPSFGFHLMGSSLPPPIEILPNSLDFGNQFVTSAGFENRTLPISLRNTGETGSLSLECLQTSCSAFHCAFEPCVLEPSEKTVDSSGQATALITFAPDECKHYRATVSFRVNGATVYTIPLRGRGTPLELDVEIGNLLVGTANSKLRASSHTDKLSVCSYDTPNGDSIVATPSNHAFLGRLRVGQCSRRTVKIVNKGKVPLKLLSISMLPKSPILNEVHVSVEQPRKRLPGDLPRLIDIEAIRHSVPATNDKPTLKIRKTPHMFLAASGGWLEVEIVFTPSAAVPEFLEQVSIAVVPIQMADLDTLATIGSDGKFVWVPTFTIGGSCKAVDIHLASTSMMLGTIVVGSQASKNLAVVNRGDLGSRFQWDDKTFGPELTITPMKGYLHPHTTVNFTVTVAPKTFNLEQRYEGVRCLLENGASVQVNLTAICVPPTVAKAILQFSCPVRETDTRGVTVANRTNSHWFLKPVVRGSEWSGAETFEVGPQETGFYEITYHPLRMCTSEEKHRVSRRML